MAAELEILYEDEWLVAVDKPAGILVHGDGTGAPTLTGLLREQLLTEAEGLEAAGELSRAGAKRLAADQLQATQRLDKDTTGIVVFSACKATQPALDALMAAHDGVEKRYLAVVRGEFPEGVRTIDAAIARDRHDSRRMRAVPQPSDQTPAAAGARGDKAKRAETRVTRLAVAGGRKDRRSLLLAELKTGRRHQIRVHLSSVGYPVLGDALYGIPAERRGTTALMLHAFEEHLVHPKTEAALTLRTVYPHRFSPLFPESEIAALLP